MLDGSTAKALLMQFFEEVWNEGDVEASDKYIASRYTVHHDPGDPWDKKELDLPGYKDRVRLSRAPFPDQRFTVHELIAEGNAVVASWFWTGTHRGNIPGFPATGKSLTMSGITVYYFDGHRLTGHWQITDRLGIFQQLRRPSAPAQ